MSRKFEKSIYPKILLLVTSPDHRNSAIEGCDATHGGENAIKNIECIPFSSVKLNPALDKAWLADEEDVGVFLKRLCEILPSEIRNNKRIQT